MTACAHEHLQLEETAAHYRCAACGQRVVVLRIEEPPEAPPAVESPAPAVESPAPVLQSPAPAVESPAPTESPAPADDVDVKGHIWRFIPAQRRLPSKIKR